MSTALERAQIRHRPTVVSVELDGRVVVFDERSGRVRSLNATGSIVWQLLDGTCTVGELADAVAQELGAERATARADVRQFVAELLQYGFVERVR
jgi:hypothetical protein